MTFHSLSSISPDDRNYLGMNGASNGVSVHAISVDNRLGSKVGDKVGRVEDVLVDDRGQSQYLVVDAGNWVVGKKTLVPVEQCIFDESHQRVLVTGLYCKEQLQQSPSYHGHEAVDQVYERQIRAIYGNGSRTVQAKVESQESHNRITSFRSAPQVEPDVDCFIAVEDSLPVETEAPVEIAVVSDRTTSVLPSPATHLPDQATHGLPPVHGLSESPLVLQLHEEQLTVNKTWQKTGEVRVIKQVKTAHNHLSIPIAKEKIIIEISTTQSPRNSASDPNLDPAHDEAQGSELARVSLAGEVAEVCKEPRVWQEVTIRKEVIQDIIEIGDTVRREELDIKREGDPKIDIRDERS